MSLIKQSVGHRSDEFVRRHLAILADEVRDKFNCSTVAFTGSVALWLNGEHDGKWSDFDVLTDRILAEKDLPWPPSAICNHSWLFKSSYGKLEVMYIDAPGVAPWQEWQMNHLVTLPDGLVIFDPDWLKKLCYCIEIMFDQRKRRSIVKPTLEEFREIMPFWCGMTPGTSYGDLEQRFLSVDL